MIAGAEGKQQRRKSVWFWSKAAPEPSPAKSGTSADAGTPSSSLLCVEQTPPASPALAAHWTGPAIAGPAAPAPNQGPASPSSTEQHTTGGRAEPAGLRTRSAYFEQEELHQRPELDAAVLAKPSLPMVTAPQPLGKSPKGFSLTRSAPMSTDQRC